MLKLSKLKNNRLVKQTITYAMTDGLSRAIPFAMMPVLAMFLKPSEFGIATNYLIFVSLISAIIGLNTYSYYSVEYYRVEESKKARLAFNLILTNILAFILCLMLPLFIGSKFEEFYFIPIYWQFLGVLMGLFQLIFELFTTYLRLEEKTKLFLRYKTLASSLSAILSLLFVVVFKWSWEGRVLALALSSFILSILSIYIFRKNGMFKFNLDIPEIRNIVKYGIPLIPHKLSSWINKGVQNALITKNEGIYNTGLFAFAQNMTSVMHLFAHSFAAAFSPHVYRQLSTINESDNNSFFIKSALIKKSYLALLLFGVILFIVYFVLVFFIELLFNNDYESSIIYLPYFFVSAFFGFGYNLVVVYVFYSKKVRYFGIVSVAVGITAAIVNIFVIKLYGAIGAAYTAVGISVLKLAVTGTYSQTVFPMPWFKVIRSIKR